MKDADFAIPEAASQSASPLKWIGVYPASAFESHRILFAALAKLEPVGFRPVTELSKNRAAALILCLADTSALGNLPPGTPPTYACITGIGQKEVSPTGDITFASSHKLARVLRGQRFAASDCNNFLADLPAGADILASVGDSPLWAKYENGGIRFDLVSSPLPTLTPDQSYLFSHFQPSEFMGLLPLIHFVRDQLRATENDASPLRANFMFDDPNLHWPTYGFINYRTLAASANRCNY